MPNTSTIPTSTPVIGQARPTPSGGVQVYNGSTWIHADGDYQMVEFDLSYTAKNANSKALLKLFVGSVQLVTNELIFARSTSVNRNYDFSQLVEYIEMMLDDMMELKTITCYDVVADFRNNSEEDIAAGKIHIDVEFKQFDCLNTTGIKLLFTKVPTSTWR